MARGSFRDRDVAMKESSNVRGQQQGRLHGGAVQLVMLDRV